jgi:hypothetical protein
VNICAVLRDPVHTINRRDARQRSMSASTSNAACRTGFELAEVVGKKRARTEPEHTTPPPKSAKKNRQDDVLRAIGDRPVTERHILEQVGDNRYTREILRRLMALEVVQRIGKGGSNDPYLYKFVRTPEEALDLGMVDPAVDIRMQRIENKIIAVLAEQEGFVTEKQIRAIVGDNTGTGKALRRLVKNSRVERVGRGGAGNPFTYKINQDAIDANIKVAEAVVVAISVPSTPANDEDDDCQDLSECSTVASSKSSQADSDSDESSEVDADIDVADESEEDEVSEPQESGMLVDAMHDSMSRSGDDKTPDYCMFDLVKETCSGADESSAQTAPSAPVAAASNASAPSDDFVISFLA